MQGRFALFIGGLFYTLPECIMRVLCDDDEVIFTYGLLTGVVCLDQTHLHYAEIIAIIEEKTDKPDYRDENKGLQLFLNHINNTSLGSLDQQEAFHIMLSKRPLFPHYFIRETHPFR